MSTEMTSPSEKQWVCDTCNCELVEGQVTVSYMDNRFTTRMRHCPECGQVLISEEMALGKMAEVEQMLEDK